MRDRRIGLRSKNFSSSARGVRDGDLRPGCAADAALLAPQPAPDCGLKQSNLKTPDPARWTRLHHGHVRKCNRNTVRECFGQQSGAVGRFDHMGGETSMASWRTDSASDKSFFCRTGSTLSPASNVQLYACSRVNSRLEFRSETWKSSGESDDDDALRFAWGSSTR
jgi:hypothetical protein